MSALSNFIWKLKIHIKRHKSRYILIGSIFTGLAALASAFYTGLEINQSMVTAKKEKFVLLHNMPEFEGGGVCGYAYSDVARKYNDTSGLQYIFQNTGGGGRIIAVRDTLTGDDYHFEAYVSNTYHSDSFYERKSTVFAPSEYVLLYLGIPKVVEDFDISFDIYFSDSQGNTFRQRAYHRSRADCISFDLHKTEVVE